MDSTAQSALIFDTAGIPVEDRLSALHDFIAKIHLRVEVAPLGGAPLDFRLKAHHLGATTMIETQTSPHCGRRAEGVWDDKGEDRCLLILGITNRMDVDHGGLVTRLGPGDVALIDSRIPASYWRPDGGWILQANMPRRALLSRFNGVYLPPITVLPENHPVRGVISHYGRTLFDAAEAMTPRLRTRMEPLILDLAAIMLAETLDRSPAKSGYRAARMVRIKEYIEKNLHVVGFSGRMVAEHFRVTQRYVSRLFQEEGTTFTDYLQSRRLTRSRERLGAEEGPIARVSEIAAAVGFGNVSYFNRLFKREFGMSPNAYRALLSKER